MHGDDKSGHSPRIFLEVCGKHATALPNQIPGLACNAALAVQPALHQRHSQVDTPGLSTISCNGGITRGVPPNTAPYLTPMYLSFHRPFFLRVYSFLVRNIGNANASTANTTCTRSAELIVVVRATGVGLTAERCGSKKMETPYLDSAQPLRVGC